MVTVVGWALGSVSGPGKWNRPHGLARQCPVTGQHSGSALRCLGLGLGSGKAHSDCVIVAR